MSNEGQTTTEQPQQTAPRERPDQRGPRGNQEAEQIDVERGEEKIGRISGN